MSWVCPLIKKKSTHMRDSISAPERFCVTMRFLVTGDAQITIAINYRMSPTIVGKIISETCRAIWVPLFESKYVDPPSSEKEWEQIATDFENKWNFPHCLGAIDGKHVVIQAPACSGSSFYNYKKTHSIVLLSVCNAKYHFSLIDIGNSGRQSDGSVYTNSRLGYAIENGRLGIPQACKVRDAEIILPYVFVGDNAFALKPHMMKPYPSSNLSYKQCIFNYRLSRARRTVENAFDIVAFRFRIFRRPIIASIKKVVLITKAVAALHNFLMSKRKESLDYDYCPNTYIDQDGQNELIPGEWRWEIGDVQGLQDISSSACNNHSKDARKIRNKF